MADWKARLLPASFNGIPFFVESHELTGGRHVKQHEPPDRDSNFSEDIGRKTPNFRIKAHVLGDNYFFNRDALVQAMNSRGLFNFGLLVHPYLGIKTVEPVGFTLNETTQDGRIAFFDLEFVEKGDPLIPFGAINKVIDFLTRAASAVLAVQTAFSTVYSIAGLPAFAVESAEAMVDDFCKTVVDEFNNVRLKPEEHASLEKKCQDLTIERSSLVRGDPDVLIGRIDEIVNDLKDLVPDAPDATTVDSSSGRDDQLAVFRPLLVFRGVADDIPDTTPTRRQEQQNANALADSVQQLSLIRLGEKITSKQFKTAEDAVNARSLVSDAIENQLERERLDDEVFQALEDVNARLVAAVPDPDSNFQQIKEITVLDPTPTIIIAYDLYEGTSDEGILNNEQQIIDRNQIRKPAFAVGNLEVLVGAGQIA